MPRRQTLTLIIRNPCAPPPVPRLRSPVFEEVWVRAESGVAVTVRSVAQCVCENITHTDKAMARISTVP